jgi:phosphoglycerate dehydrogenase-like enzyme
MLSAVSHANEVGVFFSDYGRSRPRDSGWKTPLVELEGKTMGIVGFGKIGR